MENPMAGIDEVEQIPDPAERALEVGRRMAEIPEWHTRLKQIRRQAVVEMKDVQGKTYSEIGRELNLHRNRVQQIYEGRSGGRRAVRPTEEPRPDNA
jgi:DNA-directed RNA polymerase specialized sigma24 family protein